jgi:hypothetical protein
MTRTTHPADDYYASDVAWLAALEPALTDAEVAVHLAQIAEARARCETVRTAILEALGDMAGDVADEATAEALTDELARQGLDADHLALVTLELGYLRHSGRVESRDVTTWRLAESRTPTVDLVLELNSTRTWLPDVFGGSFDAGAWTVEVLADGASIGCADPADPRLTADDLRQHLGLNRTPDVRHTFDADGLELVHEHDLAELLDLEGVERYLTPEQRSAVVARQARTT